MQKNDMICLDFIFLNSLRIDHKGEKAEEWRLIRKLWQQSGRKIMLV